MIPHIVVNAAADPAFEWASPMGCEVGAAHEYAFDGLIELSRDELPGRCEGSAAREMGLLRSRSAPRGGHPAWKVFRVCDEHFFTLMQLDQSIVSTRGVAQTLFLPLDPLPTV